MIYTDINLLNIFSGRNSQMAEQNVTLVIVLIRSFEHRTTKPLPLHNVSLDITTEKLLEMVQANLSKVPVPFRSVAYNCMKISHKAHLAKTNNPVINLENDALFLDPGKSLKDSGIEHETEISCFVREAYDQYKKDPKVIW